MIRDQKASGSHGGSPESPESDDVAKSHKDIVYQLLSVSPVVGTYEIMRRKLKHASA